MGLSLEDIRRQLTENPKRRTINRAILHQNRIRFHAQTEITPHICQPTSDFLAFVSNLIPSDKFKIFKTLFRFPVKTNEVTAICFDKLARIFDGRNPAFNYQFMSTEQRDDWEYYRQDVLNEPEIWSTKGWEYFKTEINSVLIVDLPQEQGDDRYPRPYFYWLPISQVIGFDADSITGLMRWIIFRQPDKRIAVIDDERYRVFREEAGGIGELLVEAPHRLGYCPARFFWNEALNLNEPDVKMSPLTKELESLDWFLFYHLSKRHLDLYGAYPIYSGYEQSCDFTNSENGDYCDGGFLKDKQGTYRFDAAGLLMRCPKCGDKRIAGVGSFVEVPIPGENQPDLRNPVQMLTVDRNSLDYNVAEEERLRNDIITAVVGTNEEVTTREALNEQQIKANFESQSTILNRVKRGFEEAQQFVDETICRLRYGNMFISAKVNLGTDFYVYDVAELRERFKTAKESGASEAELDALQNQIIETEYRNNPTQLQRMLILGELEPYRHLTRAEVLELYDKGIVSDTDLRIKLNFSNFVRRFERESTNILEFGTQIPFQRKVDIINRRFAEYASESLTNNDKL
ncbi:MAG: hypothetical protein NC344_06845 [Bacteroidales bacterium]|nr:hypothetical protein [Bacteroidales bacterium]MCM1147534.1 hypothetical protein [Bacteroidales bacterium]MCM1206324.1 hypothetical protein [Bacillota bacterium]MCM1511248.1 hypothetical protein [Clostridium sp.]